MLCYENGAASRPKIYHFQSSFQNSSALTGPLKAKVVISARQLLGTTFAFFLKSFSNSHICRQRFKAEAKPRRTSSGNFSNKATLLLDSWVGAVPAMKQHNRRIRFSEFRSFVRRTNQVRKRYAKLVKCKYKRPLYCGERWMGSYEFLAANVRCRARLEPLQLPSFETELV